MAGPLQLAVLGWPIIRDDVRWMRWVHAGFSDCGDFEGLAFRIRKFERYFRGKHWHVPPPNPSFATLLKLVGIERHQAGFAVSMSDGRTYSVPFELLDPMPTADDPLSSVVIDGDSVVWTLQSGAWDEFGVELVLYWNQSPEHMARTIEYAREDRRRKERSGP